MKKYDLCVIGGGPSGYAAAMRAIDFKKNVILIERDRIDRTREIAPVVQAKDAKELITDGMTIDKVIETLIRMFREEIPEEVWPSN